MERTLERLPEVWGRAKTNEDLLMSDFSRRSSAVQRSAMARKRVKFRLLVSIPSASISIL